MPLKFRDSSGRFIQIVKKPDYLHCTRCGSKNITSKGNQWKCNVCGRHMVKIPNNLKCEKCESRNIQSLGSNWKGSWRCNNCGHMWKKSYSQYKLRPDHPCPDCNSIHISRNGLNWLCKGCGRSWRRVARSRTPRATPPKDLTCPECESDKIRSFSGINWLCNNCGRSFRKKYRKSDSSNTTEWSREQYKPIPLNSSQDLIKDRVL